MQIIKYKKKYQAFGAFLKNAHENPLCAGRGIDDFLIQPIQRVPRYELLLQNLLKYTDRQEDEYDSIQFALDKVREIAGLINQRKGESDSFAQVMDVYNKVLPKLDDLVEPHRKKTREGKLLLAKEKNSKFKKRYAFLMLDILLLTKFSKVEEKYLLRYHVTLKTAQVKTMHIGKDAPKKFLVITPTKTLVLYFETIEERNSWFVDIGNCITQLHQRRDIVQQLKQKKLFE